MKTNLKLLIAVLCIAFVSCSNYGEKVTYEGTEVYYTEGVSKQKADAVGAYLVDMGFADGGAKSVQLTKDSIYNFRMVTQEKYHEDTSMDINFQALGLLLSTEVFNNEAINFVLCNELLETKRNLYIEATAKPEE